MNIFEVIGTTTEGLTVSMMVELKTLKEAIKWANDWSKKENIMLQSVRMAYLDTQKRNIHRHNRPNKSKPYEKKC